MYQIQSAYLINSVSLLVKILRIFGDRVVLKYFFYPKHATNHNTTTLAIIKRESMRYLLFIIFSISMSIEVAASCSLSGIWAYPSTTELNQNSIIVVEGYSRSQSVIDSLNMGYYIYLESGKQKIELEVIETCKGMFLITQALLRPKSNLTAGKTYNLIISNLGKKDYIRDLTKWNAEKKEYEPISWKVSSKIDNEKPEWLSEPKLVDQTMTWYGCGPAVYAVFDLKFNDASSSLIKTELYNTQTKETNTYYLTLSDAGKLKVGHGMCSGAFKFEAKQHYKIRFSLIDISGNLNNKMTEWINFDSPYKGGYS